MYVYKHEKQKQTVNQKIFIRAMTEIQKLRITI